MIESSIVIHRENAFPNQNYVMVTVIVQTMRMKNLIAAVCLFSICIKLKRCFQSFVVLVYSGVFYY